LSSRAHLNWHVGEIHITNPEILPDTPRTGLELDQKARRAIEAIRGFYEDRIADSRAFSQFNTSEKELGDAKNLVNDLDNVSPDRVQKLLEKLYEQESATKGRPPTDKVKRRFRELLSDRDIKKKRQQLIKQLSDVSKKSSSSVATSSQTLSPPKDTVLRPSASLQRTEIANQSDGELIKIDVGQLLSDVIAVVESKFSAGDELVTDLCAAIHGVFVEHGLVDA